MYPSQANKGEHICTSSQVHEGLDAKPVSTLLSMMTPLHPDEDGEAVDQREYWSIIGSLLYLTMTRSDIQFAMCLCARFEASPHTSHHQAVQ
jgi:hypothetical protein